MARSAGLLAYRRTDRGVEVLLAHPGGPFFARRDEGAWSVPKGLVEPGEDDLTAARREFAEETGQSAGDGPFEALGETRQPGGKTVVAFACARELDPAALRSNSFTLEWPRGSGRFATFPEVDRFAFFDIAQARRAIHPAQAAFLDRLIALLDAPQQ